MRRFPRTPPRLTCVFPHNPVYFVTACTYRRRTVLASDAVRNAFVNFAECAYTDDNNAVGRYVIMPDHIHLFVCGPDDFELGKWVGLMKQCFAKSVVRAPSADPVWQRRFFDHVLRSDESYAQKWNYVRDNPVRAARLKRG